MMAVDRTAAIPLHQQIYNAFRNGILDGRLNPGQRIPSTRVLALEIGVSRFPVLSAYSQLLAEGYFEARVGAGTVVSAALPESLRTNSNGSIRPAAMRGRRPVARRCSRLPRAEQFPFLESYGAFRVGQVAFNEFPKQVWSSFTARHIRYSSAESTHYGDLMGEPALRRAIATYLRTARSVRCEPEQILIVNGSQQALEMSTRLLFDPGDRIWVENPSYRLARDVFKLNQCQMVAVPVDDEGMVVQAGKKRCPKARAAFVTPSHQFPLGVTMSASRRLQLIDWAQRSGAWILEDDYDSEFRYESAPIASLQGLDANARVIYIGTFSKILFPALRLGYVVAPPDLVNNFLLMRRVMDLGMPALEQRVLADFIDEGHFARHIRRMRAHYGELRRTLVHSLRETFGTSIDLVGDDAGMHVTVMLPAGYDDEQFSRRAAQNKLSVWPLSRSYLGEKRRGFILGFGATTRAEIPKAVRKLQELLQGKSRD